MREDQQWTVFNSARYKTAMIAYWSGHDDGHLLINTFLRLKMYKRHFSSEVMLQLYFVPFRTFSRRAAETANRTGHQFLGDCNDSEESCDVKQSTHVRQHTVGYSTIYKNDKRKGKRVGSISPTWPAAVVLSSLMGSRIPLGSSSSFGIVALHLWQRTFACQEKKHIKHKQLHTCNASFFSRRRVSFEFWQRK